MNSTVYKFLIRIAKSLLIPIFGFLLVESFIYSKKSDFFTEILLENIFKQTANEYAWIDSLENDSLTILTGSSTIKYGLSCIVLDSLEEQGNKYINLAKDARDPIQIYFILKHISLDKVDQIYLGLDPWIYSRRYYRFKDRYLYLNFSFIECIKYFIYLDGNAFVNRYKALFDFFLFQRRNQVGKKTIIPDDFGSVCLNQKAENFEKLTDDFEIDKYGWSDLQFEYLYKIQQLCRENNIPLSLVVTPKQSDYTAYYKNEFSDIHTQYISKLEDYTINSPIFGKMDLLDNRGDSLLFADPYHLNGVGQKEFSKQFNKLCKTKNSINNHSWFLKP